jgi:hypothetical protein
MKMIKTADEINMLARSVTSLRCVLRQCLLRSAGALLGSRLNRSSRRLVVTDVIHDTSAHRACDARANVF